MGKGRCLSSGCPDTGPGIAVPWFQIGFFLQVSGAKNGRGDVSGGTFPPAGVRWLWWRGRKASSVSCKSNGGSGGRSSTLYCLRTAVTPFYGQATEQALKWICLTTLLHLDLRKGWGMMVPSWRQRDSPILLGVPKTLSSQLLWGLWPLRLGTAKDLENWSWFYNYPEAAKNPHSTSPFS